MRVPFSPHSAQLDDASAATRESSARALAALFDSSSGLSGLAGIGAASDAAKVEKLIAAGALKRLVPRIGDTAVAVRGHAIGALRNILAASPARVAAALTDSDAITMLVRALSESCSVDLATSSASQPSANGEKPLSSASALRLHANVAEQALMLLLEASEANEDAADAAAAKAVQPIFALLAQREASTSVASAPSVPKLPRVRHAAARLLLTLTDRNDKLCGALRAHQQAVQLLTACVSGIGSNVSSSSSDVSSSSSSEHPFTATYLVGVLANLFLQPVIAAPVQAGKAPKNNVPSGGVTKADADSALQLVLGHLSSCISVWDPVASLSPVCDALTAARGAYTLVRDTAPAAREAIKLVMDEARRARREALRALVASGKAVGNVENFERIAERLAAGGGGSSSSDVTVAAGNSGSGGMATEGDDVDNEEAHAEGDEEEDEDEEAVLARLGSGSGDASGSSAAGAAASSGSGGGGKAPAYASHPAVIAHKAALTSARVARTAYQNARRTLFMTSRRLGLALELLANLAAGADEEVEGDDDANDESMGSSSGDWDAAALQQLETLPPTVMLGPQQLSLRILSSILKSGLPQSVLALVRTCAAAAGTKVADASASGSAALTAEVTARAAIGALPQRVRRGVALSLLAVSDRASTVLSNLTSALASVSGSDAAEAALFGGSAGAAAVRSELTSLLQQCLELGGGSGGANSSLWLGPAFYSAHTSAAAAAASASLASAGAAPVSLPLTSEELGRIDGNIDVETDEEEEGKAVEAAAEAAVAAAQVFTASSSSSSSFVAGSADQAGLTAAYAALRSQHASNPLCLSYGDEDADAHALGGFGANSSALSSSSGGDAGSGGVVAQIASLVLGVDDCLAAAFRLTTVPALTLALRHATVVTSAAADSAHTPLVLAAIALAVHGPVAAPLAAASVPAGASPEAVTSALLSGPLASSSSSSGALAALSPPLGALSMLGPIKAAEGDARQHAVSLLAMLGSPLKSPSSPSGFAFRVSPPVHALIGAALGSIVAKPNDTPLLLLVAAGDALIDCYAEDIPEHDAAFAARGLAQVCAAASTALNQRLKAAVRERSLDRSELARGREVAGNLGAFAQYKLGRR